MATSEQKREADARIVEEAAAWLERIERTLSASEAKALRAWLGRPAHRETIVDRCKRWHGPEILAVLAELVPVEMLADRVERHYGKMVIGIFFALSGITLITILIALGNRMPGTDDKGNPLRAAETFQTAVGERKLVRFGDGGSMTLNTATRVFMSYQPHSRDITLLAGELALDAKHDAARPLLVSAGGRLFDVQPGGARINIRLVDREHVELTVVEGEVLALRSRLAAPLSPALLRQRVTEGEWRFGASDGGILGAGWQSACRLSSADLDRRLAWQAGRMIFRNEQLEDVLREVERYTPTRFVLTGSELRSQRVSAVFDLGDVESVRSHLRHELGIDSRAAAKGTVLLTPMLPAALQQTYNGCLPNYSCRSLTGAHNVRFFNVSAQTH